MRFGGCAMWHIKLLNPNALCGPAVACCQCMVCTLQNHTDTEMLLRRKSIDWVENTIKAEGIECKFERVDGYLMPYIEQDADYDKLEQEIGSAHKVNNLTFRCCLVSGTLSAWVLGGQISHALLASAKSAAQVLLLGNQLAGTASCNLSPAVDLLQAGLTNVVWADLGGDPKYGSVKKCLKFPGAGDFHPVGTSMISCWYIGRCLKMLAMCCSR